jgi:hypothetical protein
VRFPQGARIEAIMNRTAEDVSVDFLSRVLVDVQLDSSKVPESDGMMIPSRIMGGGGSGSRGSREYAHISDKRRYCLLRAM